MLFNKSSNGQQELKSLLGFIYASKEFSNMVTDIELAQDDIVSLIGDALYDAIELHYKSADYLKNGNTGHLLVMDQLVHNTQLPIAFYAYKSYSANADLSHSDKGRQIVTSETEKQAFEWQIERDDQALISKGHRFTDRLLAFLEKNKADTAIKPMFFDNDVFKATRNNLIGSTTVFDSIYPIDNSRRFYLKVCTFIKEAERVRILPVLSSATYDELLAIVQGGTSTAYLTSLLEYARVPLVLYSMSIAIKRLSIDVLPDGVYQNLISDRTATKAKSSAPMEFKREVSELIEKEADSALTRLQQLIAKHAAEEAGTDLLIELPTDRRVAEDKHFRV